MPVFEPAVVCSPGGPAPAVAAGEAMVIGRHALLRLPEPADAFLIVRHRDRLVVGACGLRDPRPGGVAEIGYGVFPAYRRQGAATEAVLGLLQVALARGVAQVLADVGAENRASTRVVRRLGFVEMGRRVSEDGEAVVRWVATLGG